MFDEVFKMLFAQQIRDNYSSRISEEERTRDFMFQFLRDYREFKEWKTVINKNVRNLESEIDVLSNSIREVENNVRSSN